MYVPEDENVEGAEGAEGKAAGGEGGEGKSAAAAAAPEFDYSKFGDTVKSSFREVLTEAQRQAQETASAAATAKESDADPFGKYVEPHVTRIAGPALVAAQLAMDGATFYNDADGDEQRLKIKYKDKIESLTMEQARAGRPTNRDTVWRFLKGGDLSNDIFEAKMQARERKLAEAEEAKEIGPGSARAHGKKPSKPVGEMTPDEAEEYLGAF